VTIPPIIQIGAIYTAIFLVFLKINNPDIKKAESGHTSEIKTCDP
jgi:hypothetical protein